MLKCPLQEQSDALASLVASLLCSCRQWISDQLSASTIRHTKLWPFGDATERDDTEMKDFHIPMTPVFIVQVTFQQKIGFITETCLVFTDGTIFKLLDHVVWKSLRCTVSSFFSGCHTYILYGRNPTDFTSLCNYVLVMLNCWDPCRVEMVGWSSKNALLVAIGFSYQCLTFCIQNTPVDSNMAINL